MQLVNRLPRQIDSIEIGRQLVRSGTSIGANVQEADGAESHADFIHKIKLGRKEALESRYWLRIIFESKILQEAEVPLLRDEADQLSRILYAISHSKKK